MRNAAVKTAERPIGDAGEQLMLDRIVMDVVDVLDHLSDQIGLINHATRDELVTSVNPARRRMRRRSAPSSHAYLISQLSD